MTVPDEPGPWRDDLVAALLATMLMAGLFLDGWNHINLQNGLLGGFFTWWHALLYAGFGATALWIVTRNRHLYQPNRAQPKAHFHVVFGYPLRYPLAIVGILVANVGLLGDIVWHTAFGEEQGVARVIAPFHLILFIGAGLVIAAPLRSGWHAPDHYPAGASMKVVFPPLLSLTLLTMLVAFLFQWLSAFVDWSPSIQLGRIPPELAADQRILGTAEYAGVARILVTALVLLVPLLLAMRRWRLPFGSATFLFTTVAVAMSALTNFNIAGAGVLAAVVGGLTADLLNRLTGPAAPAVSDPVVSGPTVRLIAGITPLTTWATYFIALRGFYDVAWPLDLWLGATFVAAILGLLVSFVSVPASPLAPLPTR